MSDASSASAPADLTQHRTSAYSWFVLALLTLVFTSNFLDRQILAILAQPIKEELSLSDTQIGLLTGLTFALFYTTFGIPIAWFADRTVRVRVVSISCFLWSLFTATCGLAANFWQLAAARVCVGIGEAGGSPPSHSLISDYFPPHRRATAFAVYAMGVAVGPTLGSLVGGLVAAEYGWRAAFFAVGLPGAVLAALVWMLIREPQRGRYDTRTPAAAAPSMVQAMTFFYRSPKLRSAAIACALAAFAGYGMGAWLPAFLIRKQGMNFQELALFYSAATGFSAAAGSFASGWLADRLSRRTPRAYGLVPGIAFLVSMPFFAAAVFAPDWRQSLLLLIVPTFASNMFLAPALAVIQNSVPASSRAVSSAVLLFVLNLFGLGLGPLYVGAISDLALPRFGDASLQIALAALIPIYLLIVWAHFSAAEAAARAERDGAASR